LSPFIFSASVTLLRSRSFRFFSCGVTVGFRVVDCGKVTPRSCFFRPLPSWRLVGRPCRTRFWLLLFHCETSLLVLENYRLFQKFQPKQSTASAMISLNKFPRSAFSETEPRGASVSNDPKPTADLHGDKPSASSRKGFADRKELASFAFERTRMPMVVVDARAADQPYRARQRLVPRTDGLCGGRSDWPQLPVLAG
jgi:hypothetical protein